MVVKLNSGLLNANMDASDAGDKFRSLQFKVFNWAEQWIQSGDKTEKPSFDLSEMVLLFQSLGFTIRSMDGCKPADATHLKNGQDGLRVIVSCSRSGHRCVLEEATEHCSCIKIPEEFYKDGSWRIDENKSSLFEKVENVEIGSDLIPPLSKELGEVVGSVTNYLIHVIITKQADEAQEVQSPNKRHSLDPQFLINDENLLKVDVTSPTRHRSLDTLMQKDAEVFPRLVHSISSKEIGIFPRSSTEVFPGSSTEVFPRSTSSSSMYSAKDITETASTSSIPNIQLHNETDDAKSTSDEHPNQFQALILMKNAMRDISRAVRLLDVENTPQGVAREVKSPLVHRAASSPNLSKRESKSRKPVARTSSISKPKPEKDAKKSSTGGADEGKSNKPIKRSNLYAHVKATIPKPLSLKKKSQPQPQQ